MQVSPLASADKYKAAKKSPEKEEMEIEAPVPRMEEEEGRASPNVAKYLVSAKVALQTCEKLGKDATKQVMAASDEVIPPEFKTELLDCLKNLQECICNFSTSRLTIFSEVSKLFMLQKKVQREAVIPSAKVCVGEFLVMVFKVLMSVFYPFSEEAQLQVKVKDIYASSSSANSEEVTDLVE